jgi:hypothetical protein
MAVDDLEETVAHVRRAWEGAEQPSPHPLTQEITEFLEIDDGEYARQEYHEIAPGIGLLKLYGLDLLIEEQFEIVKQSIVNHEGQHSSCVYATIPTARHQSSHILKDGNRFLIHNETGIRYVLAVQEDWNGDQELRIYSHEEVDSGWIWQHVLKWFVTEGPLKGEVIDGNGLFLDFDTTVTADDVILDTQIRAGVNLNVHGFIDAMDVMRSRGLPTSRGVLFSGPPGTGKTMLCKSIMNNRGDTTVIYVTSDTISCAGEISAIYHIARDFAPSIVMIEDIDTLGGLDRRAHGGHPLLGELLNSLSGAQTNDGVVTVATSNYAHNLDEALRDRPGRFDAIFDVGEPSLELRIVLLEDAIARIGITPEFSIEDIARKCDGYTGAWLKELLTEALLLTSLHQDISTEEIVIHSNVMEIALENIQSRRGIAASDVPQVRMSRNGGAALDALYS